jgi:hypothetical protein
MAKKNAEDWLDHAEVRAWVGSNAPGLRSGDTHAL